MIILGHSNWFTRCMMENNSNLIVLRLLRDLQYNKTPLSFLNLWCLTLIVYKCQNQPTNSSMNLFRSVFACLSGGILLPNHIGPGIIDPCEKELVDAAAYLNVEERLNITEYANHIFRLIAFEKYEKIFHFESNQTEQLLMNSTLEDKKME
jgi:zinc finger RNA-binding protein